MSELLAGLLAIIVEAILKVFTSKFFMKAIMAAMVYVFLFTIIPLLIQYLVPDSVMHATDTYFQMLTGGGTNLSCSGSQPVADQGPAGQQSVSCATTIDMTMFGQGVAYLLAWVQFPALLGVMLPVLAVTFLFKRI
jgi:hypothetical protein